MKQGARGDRVRCLHGLLCRLGHSLPSEELREALFGPQTHKAVCDAQVRFHLEVDGGVDEEFLEALKALFEERCTDHDKPKPAPAPPPAVYVIHGVVRLVRGGFAVGVQVRAFVVDLRHEQPLGHDATTNARGEYRIEYKHADITQRGRDAADLTVRAYSRTGSQLAQSATEFNAPPDVTIDPIIGGDQYLGPSEYERVVARLLPVLDGVTPEGITLGDVHSLMQTTGLAFDQIGDYAVAASFAKTSGIAIEVFYALLREKLPARGVSLFGRPASELKGALEDAIARNVITDHDDAWVDDAVAQLQKQSTRALLAGNASALGGSLTAAGVPAGAQQAFSEAYVSQSAASPELWNSLTTSIGAGAVEKIQTGIEWATLTFNHPPLIAALSSTLGRPSEVARLSPADWRAAIEKLAANGQPAVPDRIEGATDDARRSFYTLRLYTLAQSAFPTVALSAQLQSSLHPVAAGMRAILDTHPDWNIAVVPARAFLATHQTDGETALAIGQLQRVHRFTDNAAWSVKLLENKIVSAQAIARASVDVLAKTLGAATTETTLLRDRARAIVDAAAVVHARFAPTYNMPVLPAVPQLGQLAVEVQTYQDVFAAAPLCGCDECGSVLGASAYLVDLFQFLQTWSQPAWDELFKRRPDLKGIELSCTNTLTPLPLIDLVNELLEDKAQGNAPVVRQTTWSAPDLAANPEHLGFDAYKPLATTTYPWTLPFDLSLEEARVYLQHLGVTRFDVMRTLASSSTPDEKTLATELLGMTASEWDTIAAAAAVADGTADPNWGGMAPTDPAPVSTFLERSGLVAADLAPLLDTRFVNPDTTPPDKRIGLSIPDDKCNPETAQIVHLHGDGMDRIRRFVRLQRRLGWTFGALDAALAALTGGTIDGSGLPRIARFERMRRATQLPVAELLTWWAPLDIRPAPDGRSQYDDVFVSRSGASVGTSPGSASTPDPLALDGTGQPQGAAGGATLRAVLPRIIAALNITADDADALLAPDLAASLEAPLSVANLSALYRALSLSRAAKLSPGDYERLRRLSSLQPFASDIDSARQFLELAAQATGTALTLPEWAFLLRGETIEGFFLDNASIDVLLLELRTALKSVDAATNSASADPDAVGVVRRKLAELVKGSDLASAIAFLDEAPGTPLFSLAAPLTLLSLSSTTVTALTTPTPPTDANVRARYEWVRQPLLEHLALRDKSSLVVKRVAAATGITVSLANLLAQDPFGLPGSPALLPLLLGSAVVDDTVPIDPSPTGPLAAIYRGLRLFGKQSLLAGRLRLGAEELKEFQARHTSLGWLDWTHLPTQDTDARLTWKDVAGLLQYVAIRDRAPRGREPLSPVFGLATQPGTDGELLADLARRTGWEDVSTTATTAPQLDALATTLGLTRSSFSQVDAWVRLGAAVDLARRMGLPGTTIGASGASVDGWRGDVTPSLAADIKGAARSKHGAGAWLTIAKALRDPLREKQRDALLAYLVKTGAYTDANDAFDDLLIDVEMSACMLTSRIKQAVGSTQLFIERCLLAQETEALRLPPEAAWQWKWMRSYRIWEANRQVFLYPENWLQPELRTDKTPFFQELEDELHQKAITAENAEDALHHYLEKLDHVAMLEIVGFVTQPDAFNSLGGDGVDTSAVHVIGRTPAAPHSYYYRRLERGWRWTAWEAVNVDVVGDHVVPILWHRRLLLFWLQFHEKTDPDNQTPPSIATGNNHVTTSDHLPQPPKHLEIMLAWSERKDDRWLPRRMSKDPLIVDPCNLGQLPRFVVRGFVDNDVAAQLHVQVIWNGPSEDPDDEAFVGEFVFGSCTSMPDVREFESVDGHRVAHPKRCERDGQWFAETTLPSLPAPDQSYASAASGAITSGGFMLPILRVHLDDSLYLMRGADTRNLPFPTGAANQQIRTLASTPGQFTLSWPHEYAQFLSSPLFYWDQQRVFYITAQSPYRIPPGIWFNHSRLSPGLINAVQRTYLPSPTKPPPLRLLAAAGIGEFEKVPVAEILRVQHPAETGLVMATDEASSAPVQALYRFFTHFHPYACQFLERVDRFGVSGFYAWNDDPVQQKLGTTPVQNLAANQFKALYQPIDPIVDPRYPQDDVDFSPCGAYSQYNWEVFLHIPVYVANRLRTEQNYEESLRWLQFVFDPTTTDTSDVAPKRWWKMARLRAENPKNGDIVDLLQGLADGKDLTQSNDCEAESLTAQIRLWRHDPFDPHAIARLRPVAYMKWVFNLYVQTLIDWGDLLFRQNTLESINLATLRYVMAAKLLGTRPDPIPRAHSAPPVTYDQMLSGAHPIDAFSDELENIIPGDVSNDPEASRFPITYGPGQVFCVPPNDQLFRLWDTVADRLFKIRHCMNIEGRVQQLPLFEPPINPALLIAAREAGVDLSSAVNGIEAPVPRYRFAVVYERARELVGELRQLGSALQAALEKRDGEDLALLRSSNERALLDAVHAVRQKQVDESNSAFDALTLGRAAMQTRVTYYQQKSQELANAAEWTGMALMIASQILNIVAQGIHMAAGVVSVIPQFKLGVTGVGGSPTATAEFGGQQIKGPIDKAGIALASIGGALSIAGTISTTVGGFQRRQDEMKMQSDAGSGDLARIDQELVTAQIHQDIAQKELANHELQMEQAGEVDSFLRSKFTNRDLFDWMSGQLSALYFQTYQLAFDLARRAERAFRFELGLFDDQRTFIQFGYWDNLKQGLLAGERLSTDLVRMHATYLEENKRELELTKHVSLALTDPIALLALRQDGACYVALNEQLFDLDMPGLYLRRLKSVGLSIPCVSGAYTTVACKLTLLSDTVRINPTMPGNSYGPTSPTDSRFVTSSGGTQSIVTSTAQNDAGLFEVNLRDERYLPFEGAGAISQWKVELVKEARQFDWTTISDVVLHLRYTARDGGDLLRTGAVNGLTQALHSGVRLFSVRSDFPDAMAAFLNPPPATPGQALTLDLRDADFPYPVQGKSPKLGEWLVLVRWSDGTFGNLPLTLAAPKPLAGPAPLVTPMTPWPNSGDKKDTMGIDWAAQQIAEQVLAYRATNAGLGAWTLTADLANTPPERLDATGHIRADQLDDVILVVGYAA